MSNPIDIPAPGPAARTLIVFAREPVAGRVKTRLIPALGAEGAANLYRRLLAIALDAAARVPGADPELWCADAPADGGECARLARRHRMRWYHQPPGDLGARMAAALDRALAGGGRAVLIGSDCPGYAPGYLAAAFAALGEHDAVLGPATDGGYVLIGLRRPAPELFARMPWGTDTVLEETRTRLAGLGLRCRELPALDDLDRPENLAGIEQLLDRS